MKSYMLEIFIDQNNVCCIEHIGMSLINVCYLFELYNGNKKRLKNKLNRKPNNR